MRSFYRIIRSFFLEITYKNGKNNGLPLHEFLFVKAAARYFYCDMNKRKRSGGIKNIPTLLHNYIYSSTLPMMYHKKEYLLIKIFLISYMQYIVYGINEIIVATAAPAPP